MAKASHKEEIELVQDAWERFERATEVVVKAPPQHRVTKKKKSPAKKRVAKARAKRA